MVVRQARQRQEKLGMPTSAPAIGAAPDPRRPRLGMTLRLPQTGQRDLRPAVRRGVTPPPFEERIRRRGKCPGPPTIKPIVRKTQVQGTLVGPRGTIADRVLWATTF